MKSISGLVTYLDEPVPDANILVKGTSNGVKTNDKGVFHIVAKKGEILVISYVGLQTVEITLTEKSSFLSIPLSSKVEELNEVVVKKNRHKTQKDLLADYPTNKSLIKTNWGILNEDHSSYSIMIFDGSNLRGVDFLASLQLLYPRMKINATRDKVYLPSYSSRDDITAIFDVDGFIYVTPPTFLSVEDIDRVAFLTRNGAFIRYGPQGTGGVIIINTKEQTRIDDLGVERTYDISALRDSIKTELNATKVFAPKVPGYMAAFNDATSERNAKEIFDNLERENVGITPYYYLETSNYFEKKWGDFQESDTILKMAEEKHPKDVNLLKALAFTWEQKGEWDNAYRLYLQVLKLRSRDGQSHLDLGKACSESGNYQKALGIYAKYARGVQQLDTILFGSFEADQIMITESNNILRLRGNELSIDGIAKSSEEELENQNTRLVFEWNNSQAEFELQFVNPRDNYDGWSNRGEGDNEEVISSQKGQGDTSKQFFLDNTLTGEWKVNINYFGNQTMDPTYLKVTTYFNYGKPTQTMDIKVFKLTEKQVNTKLLVVDNVEELITN